MAYIKTRLISSSGIFYGITNFKKAIEFRFTSDWHLFPYYNSHAACSDKRKKANVNEACVQIGNRCHCIKKQLPNPILNLFGKCKQPSEELIYNEIELIFNQTN